jgi:hypothetical protein
VKHENLSLIPPEFECPLPPLAPAVFPPQLRELPPPALDQFDLDEHFASSRQRLAQLTNKCTSSEDLDYYIKEAGEILGVTGALQERAAKGGADAKKATGAKHVLHFIFSELVRFKKVNHDPAPGEGGGGGEGGPVMMDGGGGGGEMMVFDGGAADEPQAMPQRGGGMMAFGGAEEKGGDGGGYREFRGGGGGDYKGGGEDMKMTDMDGGGGGEVMSFHK